MKSIKEYVRLQQLTTDEAEAEIEWILEAKAEGYTWKQLASMYRVSVPTLKKFLKGELLKSEKI